METGNLNSTVQPTSITPFLVVNQGANAINFYQAAFHGTVLERHEGANGRVIAKIAIGRAEFFVGDEEPEYENLSPTSIGGTAVRVVLIVHDPDAMYQRAIEAGATEICPVTTEESWKIGKLKDPFGHVWEIGHPL